MREVDTLYVVVGDGGSALPRIVVATCRYDGEVIDVRKIWSTIPLDELHILLF